MYLLFGRSGVARFLKQIVVKPIQALKNHKAEWKPGIDYRFHQLFIKFSWSLGKKKKKSLHSAAYELSPDT